MPKRGPGQPPYEPTPADRATVQNLAALGATHKEIAMCVGRYGVSEPTLRKHFRRELNNSLTEVKALCHEPSSGGNEAPRTGGGLLLSEVPERLEGETRYKATD